MASGLRALYPSVSPQVAVDHLVAGKESNYSDLGRTEQVDRLESWLRAEGLRVSKSALENGFVGSGAEHETYFDSAGLVAVKLTHDGRYGHCLRHEGAIATPLDYLRRLAWHNEIFGDDIRLHGMLTDTAGLRLVSSQPWISSHPDKLSPSQPEIDAFLMEFGFFRSAAYPDGFIYYNGEAELVIGDAQPANLLLDDQGFIHPIDLVIAVPEEAFLKKLISMGTWQAREQT